MKNLKSKTSKLLFPLCLVFLVFTLQSSSCSHDDVATTATVTSTPVDGTWRVSYFFDSGDETSNFTSYTFAFNSGGQLIATKGTETITGSWSQSSTKLIISFGSHAILGDFNDDWLIVEKNATSIKLKDDNPARNEQLQFVKL